MMATLLFTLSRGAWLAFAVTAAVVGFATNRGLVVLLIVVFLVGYRWAPREAVTRADLTVRAVEQSRQDSSLEESLDDSAALRIIQWKSFPTLFLESPVWGTGLGTYPERLGRETRVFRPAHATMVQIGTEMGALGLIGYLGLLGTVAIACLRRARQAGRGSFRARGRPWRPGGDALSLSPRLQWRPVPRPHRDHVLLAPGWSVSGLHGARAPAPAPSRDETSDD